MAQSFCPQCGNARQGALRFCSHCGFDFWKAAGSAPQEPSQQPPTAFTPQHTSAPTSSNQPPQSTKNGISTAAVVGGVVILLVAAGAAVLLLMKPGAAATPSLTPAATPTPALHGTGVITFGRDFDKTTLEITSPASTFKVTDEIAWSASLSDAAGATSLEFQISKVSSGGSETVVYDDTVKVSDPSFDIFANKAELGSLLDGAGTYTMRYFRDSTKLAEGTFTLTQ